MGIRCYKCGKEIEKGFVLDEGAGYKICEECAFDSNNVFDAQGNIYSVSYERSVKNMISATEARFKAIVTIQKGLTDELKKITEEIQEAIAKGKFEIHNEGCLSDETKKVLKENGYKIETGSQYNQSYYFIRW